MSFAPTYGAEVYMVVGWQTVESGVWICLLVLKTYTLFVCFYHFFKVWISILFERQTEIFICWFILQEPTTARVGSNPGQGWEALSDLPCEWQRPEPLEPLSAFPGCTLAESWIGVEDLELELTHSNVRCGYSQQELNLCT